MKLNKSSDVKVWVLYLINNATMKKIIKIITTVFGISAICYLVAREKVLLKKTAHDCVKIKFKLKD